MNLAPRAFLPLIAGIAVLGVAACGSTGGTSNPSATELNRSNPNNGLGGAGTLGSSDTTPGIPRGSGDSAGSSGSLAPLGLAGGPSTPTIGLGSSTAVATPQVAGAMARQATIEITSENGSNVNGTATLSDLSNDRTRVLLMVTGAAGDHPAHIHDGQCPDVNPAPKWPLNDVQNGTSTTDLDASLDDITSSATAINVHTSPQDETPVACGNVHPPA